MKKHEHATNRPSLARRAARRGNVMVVVLGLAALIAVGAGATFLRIADRQRLAYHAAAWSESLHAAESGVETAFNALRTALVLGDLSELPEFEEGAAAGTVNEVETVGAKRFTSDIYLRETMGGVESWASVTVDRPPELNPHPDKLLNYQWWRIRSIGFAEIPGSARPAGDKEDIRLRQVSLNYDKRTKEELDMPRATRVVEVIARPLTAFEMAQVADVSILYNNHNPYIDSYNSNDPAHSNPANVGHYPGEAGRLWNGDIASNGSIDLSNATVYGSMHIQDLANAKDTNGVKGEKYGDFYREMMPVSDPGITSSAGAPTSIGGGTVINALPVSSGGPLYINVDSIRLSGQNKVTVKGDPSGAPSYVVIQIEGDFATSGQGEFIIESNAYVRIFIKGDMDVTGNGFTNKGVPGNLQIYGVDREGGQDGNIKIAGNGNFSGAIYAPTYNIEVKGGGSNGAVYGAAVGKTLFMNGVTHWHYDEALREGGVVIDYKVASWYEDDRPLEWFK